MWYESRRKNIAAALAIYFSLAIAGILWSFVLFPERASFPGVLFNPFIWVGSAMALAMILFGLWNVNG